MNAPLYHVGQRVQVSHDDGSRSEGTVIAIEAVYWYRVNLDPGPGIHGGEIPGASWQEDTRKAHSIRAIGDKRRGDP